MGKTLEAASNLASDKTQVVYPAEVARGVYMRNAPSLAALKLLHLMIDTAGGLMASSVLHEIRLADIRKIEGMDNHTRASLTPLFEELRAVVIRQGNPTDDADRVEIGGVLDQAVLNRKDPISGDTLISWYFGRSFMEMAEKSDHWAIIDRQTVFHLGSRYSVLLYQHIASLVKLDWIVVKTFTIPELRALLAVPIGKLDRFADLNRRAIQPAIAEINHLSRLTLTATPNKIGRTVASVTIGWQVKEDPRAAKRELEVSKIGRKARRDGTAETVIARVDDLPPFPQAGGFTYSPAWKEHLERIWADLGRPHDKRPDSSLVAKQVRGIAVDQKISFDSPKMASILANVLNKWGQT